MSAMLPAWVATAQRWIAPLIPAIDEDSFARRVIPQ